MRRGGYGGPGYYGRGGPGYGPGYFGAPPPYSAYYQGLNFVNGLSSLNFTTI